MVEIDSKLEFLHNMVYSSAKSESENALFNSADLNSKQIEKRRIEIEEQNQEYISHRISVAEKKSNEELSIQREENIKAVRIAKENCLDDLLKSLTEKLISFCNTEEYRVQLKKEIQSNLTGETNEKIQVTSRDKDYVQSFINKNVILEEISDSYIGGFVITNAKNTIRKNFSYLEKIRSNEYEIGKKLYEILNKKVVEND